MGDFDSGTHIDKVIELAKNNPDEGPMILSRETCTGTEEAQACLYRSQSTHSSDEAG